MILERALRVDFFFSRLRFFFSRALSAPLTPSTPLILCDPQEDEAHPHASFDEPVGEG
jgi:hypothetical protein